MNQEPLTDNIPANRVIFIGFADNKVPEFKEVRYKDYIMFGEKNDFPDHLLYLYNKSSNHGAIVNGKVKYIFGKGLPVENTSLVKVNKYGESLNTVVKKSCHDIELFGGYYWEIVWKMGGGMEVFHMPFHNLRRGKDGGWFYKKNWKDTREQERFIPDFDPKKRSGAQIFAYKEYRPGVLDYPLPGYFSSLNDIETDVEISKYNLSVIKNGMFSSKMVTFFSGTPTDEAKKKLERSFKDKFNGSENAGNTMLVFASKGEEAPKVDDLSTTDLDKLFDQLNKTTQAEIFTGHEVTSPMLFGVKTEGQLGGRDEIKTSFEIFKNTYVNHKQEALEQSISWVFSYFNLQPLKIQPVDIVGFTLSDDKLAEIMPKEWVYEQLGVDISKYPSIATPANGAPANENLKNMTGRQFQQLQRILTKYRNGKLKRDEAVLMLKNSYQLSDDDINTFLSDDPERFSADYTEDEVAEMFESVGTTRQEFTVIKSTPYRFEEHYDEFADIKQTDSSILDLIRKDKRITPQVIAETLNIDPSYVSARIKSLEKAGVLTQTSEKIGLDTIIERAINPEAIDSREKPETVDIYIRYAYEAKPGLEPIIATTRPFCRKLIELDKLYSRSEIESISQRVGFSVWDRKGGWWGTKDECRHRWVRYTLIKKK